MNTKHEKDQEIIDFRNVNLPIGVGKAQGPIEDFVITIYDRERNVYRFKVKGGNICTCDNENAENLIEYEVQ